MGNQGIHELPRPHKHIPSSRHQHFFEHNSDFISIRNSSKFQSTIPTMSRPEHSAPPEIFYNEAEAEKYTNNTRMMNIQVWHANEHRNLCDIVLMSPSTSTIRLNLPTSGRNDWACPWASVFTWWALLSAWSWLWQWSVWGVYWGAGDFHWELGTYSCISLCCHLRATVGLVLTSRLPCWGLPMRGSWRAILLVEILGKDFLSGFWKDCEL